MCTARSTSCLYTPMLFYEYQAYIPIEKMIRLSKESASTSLQCKTSGNHHHPATYTAKESRATLACLYRTSGQFYMLQLIFVDCYETTYATVSSKDVGMLQHHWLVKRFGGTSWLKVPTILFSLIFQ